MVVEVGITPWVGSNAGPGGSVARTLGTVSYGAKATALSDGEFRYKLSDTSGSDGLDGENPHNSSSRSSIGIERIFSSHAMRFWSENVSPFASLNVFGSSAFSAVFPSTTGAFGSTCSSAPDCNHSLECVVGESGISVRRRHQTHPFNHFPQPQKTFFRSHKQGGG